MFLVFSVVYSQGKGNISVENGNQEEKMIIFPGNKNAMILLSK